MIHGVASSRRFWISAWRGCDARGEVVETAGARRVERLRKNIERGRRLNAMGSVDHLARWAERLRHMSSAAGGLARPAVPRGQRDIEVGRTGHLPVR